MNNEKRNKEKDRQKNLVRNKPLTKKADATYPTLPTVFVYARKRFQDWDCVGYVKAGEPDKHALMRIGDKTDWDFFKINEAVYRARGGNRYARLL